MPKVEAKDHRRKQRVPPLPQPRFPTLAAEHHTYEFDRHYGSLRISGTGYQDFLSKGDARQLYGLLRRVYEPPARPTTPLKLERRARQHRRSKGKSEAIQLTGQSAPEARQETALEFGEYNGWPNRPTWNVFTVMSSYYDTYEMLHRLSLHKPGGRGNVRRAVIDSIDKWRNNIPSIHAEVAGMLVQDFVMNGVRRVEWTPILDSLQGRTEALGEADPLTTLTYDLLQQTDWKAIVAGAEYLSQADDMLRDWVENQCLTWINSPDARKYISSVAVFTETILDRYLQAVQWDKVTQAFRGE